MYKNFSDAYRIGKVLYIDKELAAIPNLHRGYDNGDPVVRLYGKNNKTEKIYYLSRAQNLKYADLADRRANLQDLKKRLIRSLKRNVHPGEYKIEVTAAYKLTKRNWDRMKSQSHPRPVNTDYWFEGLNMRSRFEVNVAITLRKLGLDFKYEPCITIGGNSYHPDFVVYLPEFEVCFIIECMGRIGDGSYSNDVKHKLIVLLDNGYLPFRDFLLLGGRSDYIPTKDWVEDAIVSIVNSIAGECVIPENRVIVRNEQDPLINLIPPDIAALLEREWTE